MVLLLQVLLLLSMVCTFASVLLAAEVGVVSIRHGSDLEREFFPATKPHG